MVNRQQLQNTSVWINRSGHPGIRRSDEWQPLLDRPKLCLDQMLPGTAAVAKPRVIGDLQKHRRSRVAARHFSWEYRLITNQRAKTWHAWRGNDLRPGSRSEPAGAPGELIDADRLQPPLERQLFSEWNKMMLVVDRGYRSGPVHDKQAVVPVLASVSPLLRTLRANDQRRVSRQEPHDFSQDARVL